MEEYSWQGYKRKVYAYVEYYRYIPLSCHQGLEDSWIDCDVEVVPKKGDHIITCQSSCGRYIHKASYEVEKLVGISTGSS